MTIIAGEDIIDFLQRLLARWYSFCWMRTCTFFTNHSTTEKSYMIPAHMLPKDPATGAPHLPWKVFLESAPPFQVFKVTGLARQSNKGPVADVPTLELKATRERKRVSEVFEPLDKEVALAPGEWKRFFFSYKTRYGEEEKTYAVVAQVDNDQKNGFAMKMGEWPVFGPPVPERLESLLSPVPDLYRMGHQAEFQGMGYGAFAYYTQTMRKLIPVISQRLTKAAQVAKASSDIITMIEVAGSETDLRTALASFAQCAEELAPNQGNPFQMLTLVLDKAHPEDEDDTRLEDAMMFRLSLEEIAERY